MKFDFVIGNPPYQQDSIGANESDMPLYHYFYDTAFNIADKVELITPARFLFDAGYTPKLWNEKMLADVHFKVLRYEPKSNKVFSSTDIKGGIAITYRDVTKKFGAIGAFTAFSELNSIKHKVDAFSEKSLSEIITNRGLYRYSDKAYKEQPDEMKKQRILVLHRVLLRECLRYLQMKSLMMDMNIFKYMGLSKILVIINGLEKTTLKMLRIFINTKL